VKVTANKAAAVGDRQADSNKAATPLAVDTEANKEAMADSKTAKAVVSSGRQPPDGASSQLAILRSLPNTPNRTRQRTEDGDLGCE
jgi:hypothetical protein|tara:strand:+ start:7415 stop:7672 length:258 start_codon:yes stop_codon:yes gene_type:complete